MNKNIISYNFDHVRFGSRKIPNYIKQDGHFHTNAEVNIRYLRKYDGTLLPCIPSAPSAENPHTAAKTNFKLLKSSFIETDNKSADPLVSRRYLKSAKSDKDLGNYFYNMQYHKRGTLPPI